MVGWHHWLDGHGFGWTLGVGDGQGGLECCGSWGRKESDMTEQLNWTDYLYNFHNFFHFCFEHVLIREITSYYKTPTREMVVEPHVGCCSPSGGGGHHEAEGLGEVWSRWLRGGIRWGQPCTGSPGREIPSHGGGKCDVEKRFLVLQKLWSDVHFLILLNSFLLKWYWKKDWEKDWKKRLKKRLRKIKTEFCFLSLFSYRLPIDFWKTLD